MKPLQENQGVLEYLASLLPVKDRPSFISAAQELRRSPLSVQRAFVIFLAGVAWVIAARLANAANYNNPTSNGSNVELYNQPRAPRRGWQIWTTIVLLFVGSMIGGLYLLRKSETAYLRNLARNPIGHAAFARDSMEAIRIANKNADSIATIAALMNIPEAQVALVEGKIVIVVPNNSIIVDKGENDTRIFLVGDTSRMLEYLGRNSVQDKLNAAEENLD